MKKTFKSLFALLVLVMMASFTVQAQSEGCCEPQNPEVCSACNGAITGVNVYNMFNCNTKIVTINTYTPNNLCDIVDYCWSTNDANAQITEVGGQARIRFSGSGTYSVTGCAAWEYTPNPEAGVCCACTTITVNVCP